MPFLLPYGLSCLFVLIAWCEEFFFFNFNYFLCFIWNLTGREYLPFFIFFSSPGNLMGHASTLKSNWVRMIYLSFLSILVRGTVVGESAHTSFSCSPGVTKAGRIFVVHHGWQTCECWSISLCSPVSLLNQSLSICTFEQSYHQLFCSFFFFNFLRPVSWKKTFVIMFGSFILTRYVILLQCFSYIINY